MASAVAPLMSEEEGQGPPPPPRPSHAVPRSAQGGQEGTVPPMRMPPGAVVKEEVFPLMPPGAFVKEEVVVKREHAFDVDEG